MVSVFDHFNYLNIVSYLDMSVKINFQVNFCTNAPFLIFSLHSYNPFLRVYQKKWSEIKELKACCQDCF